MAGWILGQAMWLGTGYYLEFLGQSVYVPGLLGSAAVFFGVNCWILGILVGDAGFDGVNVDGVHGKGKVVSEEKRATSTSTSAGVSGKGTGTGAGTRLRKN